jgi:tRNA threonylcarbamoyladenosine biosynthesis protein TsaB
MKILAIDTSTNACSVCIMASDEVVGEYFTMGGKTHSERLMPAIDMLFSHLDFDLHSIDGIAVIHGPGSFTGLRISLSVVKGLAFALRIPIVTASALEIAALHVSAEGLVCPAMDARRKEIFTCLYEKAGPDLKMIFEPKSMDPAQWKSQLPDAPISFIGPGAHLYWDILRNHSDSRLIHPAQLSLAPTLARFATKQFMSGMVVAANELKAVYLRPSDAEIHGPRRSKLATRS